MEEYEPLLFCRSLEHESCFTLRIYGQVFANPNQGNGEIGGLVISFSRQFPPIRDQQGSKKDSEILKEQMLQLTKVVGQSTNSVFYHGDGQNEEKEEKRQKGRQL